jgi:hypothetical protein
MNGCFNLHKQIKEFLYNTQNNPPSSEEKEEVFNRGIDYIFPQYFFFKS